jgi:hypothetical protein
MERTVTEFNFSGIESILFRVALFILFLVGLLKVIGPEIGYVYRLLFRKKPKAKNELEKSSVKD